LSRALAPALALVALTLLPTIAHAAGSSAEIYRTAPPTLESEGPAETPDSGAPNKDQARPRTTPKAHGPATPTTGEEGATEPADEPEGKREGEGAERDRSAGAPGGGNKNPPRGGAASPGAAGGSAPQAGTVPREGMRTPIRAETSEGTGGG